MIICWGTSYWQKQGNKSVHDTAPKVCKQTTRETCFTHQQTWGGGGGAQCYTAQSKHLIYASYWLFAPCYPAYRKKKKHSDWAVAFHKYFYYINPNEIPVELSRKNLIFSHVKITCYLHTWEYHCCFDWKINCTLHTKNIIKVKLFGSSLVFI